MMKKSAELTRREFLKSFATSGAGLFIGVYLSGCGENPTQSPTLFPTSTITVTPVPTGEPTETPRPTPNPEAVLAAGIYIQVLGTGMVIVYLPRTELGQGALTSLAMVVAEELDLPLENIQVEHSPLERAYGELRTGGSDSISSHHRQLSQASASARALLLSAAAQIWQVPYESCRMENGGVIHDDSGDVLTFAELVETAAEIPVEEIADLAEVKESEDYKIIGTPVGHLDNLGIVEGSTIYALDLNLPGMLFATLLRCPVLRGRVSDFDASQALAIPGVRQVFTIDSGIAVVADNTWAALQGQLAVQATWEEGGNALLNSSSLRDQFQERLLAEASTGGTILESIYEVPFFAHAPQEPMNCIADVRPDHCEVWAPTQNPGEALSRIRSFTGLPAENIQIHIPRVGGGFGRRLQVDYVLQAVQISAKAGAPIKLMWTREEDIQQGFFHPLSLHFARANLSNPTMPQISTSTFQSWDKLTYAWRSVTNFTDAFVRECFLDEMATALNQDPLDLRLEIAPASLHEVLRVAASAAGWGEPLPAGWGRGIASWSTWDVTPVAQVAEVSVSPQGEVQVQRVVCAIDCGLALNPDMVAAQMEGGIVWGLTAALKEAIDIENGRVLQSNFDNYPLLRMDEMPNVEVHILPSSRHPTGVGEMGVPPAAPAVFNAIFNATGKRLRRLPFHPDDLL